MVFTFLVILALLYGAFRIDEWSDRYGHCVKNINDMQVKLGHWVNDNLPEDAYLALDDIGAITFISGRKIIDLRGIVEPELLPLVRLALIDANKSDRLIYNYVRNKRPDYFIVFRKSHRFTEKEDIFEELYSIKLLDNIICGADEMVVFRAHWDNTN